MSLELLPFAPEVSAALNYISTAWTIKNDLKTGDYSNTAVTITSFIISSYPSETVRFGVQSGQVLYDAGYFQQNSGTPEYLRNTIEGKNNQKYLELYHSLGNFGY